MNIVWTWRTHKHKKISAASKIRSTHFFLKKFLKNIQPNPAIITPDFRFLLTYHSSSYQTKFTRSEHNNNSPFQTRASSILNSDLTEAEKGKDSTRTAYQWALTRSELVRARSKFSEVLPLSSSLFELEGNWALPFPFVLSRFCMCM